MAKDEVNDDQINGNKVAADTDTAHLTEAEKEENLREELKKALKVETADVGVLRKTLSITVPRDVLQVELDKDYKEIISEAVVPGFRRGRAPRRLVEKRFGNEIGEQVQTRIVSNAYMAAIEKEDLKVLGDPLVWTVAKDKKAKAEDDKEELLDMPTALQSMKLPEEGDLTFRCEVEIKPEFELPKLEGIRIEKPKIEISDDDVDAYIDRWRSIRGSWTPVNDGEVEADDLLVCDVKVTAEGREVNAMDNLTLAARPQMIAGVSLEDFGEKLEGAKLGETRSLEGTLPDDYTVEDLRGKTAKFDLKINEIKRMELPDLDQEFLTSIGYDSVDEYRRDVRQRLEGEVGGEAKRAMHGQVRNYLMENTKLDLPEGISSRQTERIASRRMVEMQRRGVAPAEILKQVDELRTKAREQAVSELKLYFILERIAETLEIEISEEEINSAIASIAQSYNRRFDRMRDDLIRNKGVESLYVDLRDEKCIDAVLEKAEVVESKVERKKPVRKAAKTKTAKVASAADEKTKSGEEDEADRPKRKPPKKSEE